MSDWRICGTVSCFFSGLGLDRLRKLPGMPVRDIYRVRTIVTQQPETRFVFAADRFDSARAYEVVSPRLFEKLLHVHV